jgi:hypothetical protein
MTPLYQTARRHIIQENGHNVQRCWSQVTWMRRKGLPQSNSYKCSMTEFKTETPRCTESNYIIHVSRRRNKCQGNDQCPQAWPISESEQQKADRDCNWRHNTADNCVPFLSRSTAPVRKTVPELSVNMLSKCVVPKWHKPLDFDINVPLSDTYIIKVIKIYLQLM